MSFWVSYQPVWKNICVRNIPLELCIEDIIQYFINNHILFYDHYTKNNYQNSIVIYIDHFMNSKNACEFINDIEIYTISGKFYIINVLSKNNVLYPIELQLQK